jgi:hypothetical protein
MLVGAGEVEKKFSTALADVIGWCTFATPSENDQRFFASEGLNDKRFKAGQRLGPR